MRYFTNQKAISKVERQAYNLAGTLSEETTVATSVTGYLRPLNEEQSSANGFQYGNGFSLIVEPNIDIQEGDKVTIDSVEYTVRGMVNHDRGGLTAYRRCLLLKPQR